MLRKSLPLLFLEFVSAMKLMAEPSGRGYDPNAPDLGLPGGNEVFTGLLIAIIAIPIGYIILNSGKRDNSSEDSIFPGCLGVILIGVGIVCLLPMIAWIFSILSAIFTIGIIVVIIIVILAFIFSNKK
jgi:hypothetical protein